MSPLTQTHCSCECVLDFTKFSCSLAAIGTSPSRLSFTPIHVPQSRGKSLAAALTCLRSPIWTQRRFSRIPRIRSVMLRVRLELSFVPNRLTKRRVSRQRTSSAPAGGWFHFAIFFSLLGAVLAVEIEDPAALHNHPHRELFLAACERQFNLRRVLHGCVFSPHVRLEFRIVSIFLFFPSVFVYYFENNFSFVCDVQTKRPNHSPLGEKWHPYHFCTPSRAWLLFSFPRPCCLSIWASITVRRCFREVLFGWCNGRFFHCLRCGTCCRTRFI